MSVTPKPTSVLELYRQYRTGKLIVNRRYQRKLVWTKQEKASLIESVLLGYPIPLILLAEVESENENETAFEIIDGMQRLNALFSFIENEFPVNAGTEPVWYKNKLYIRDGHEKKPQEVSGAQVAAVCSLFK